MFKHYKIALVDRKTKQPTGIIISCTFQLMFFNKIKKGQETVAMANATINFFHELSKDNNQIDIVDIYPDMDELNQINHFININYE